MQLSVVLLQPLGNLNTFPNLNESTLRPWLKKYRGNLKEKKKAKNENINLKIRQTRGRPLLLDAELDVKLRSTSYLFGQL